MRSFIAPTKEGLGNSWYPPSQPVARMTPNTGANKGSYKGACSVWGCRDDMEREKGGGGGTRESEGPTGRASGDPSD